MSFFFSDLLFDCNSFILVANKYLRTYLLTYFFHSFFSNIFKEAKKDAENIWKFEKLELIGEFKSKPYLPIPFSIFENIYILVTLFLGCKTYRVYGEYEMTIHYESIKFVYKTRS